MMEPSRCTPWGGGKKIIEVHSSFSGTEIALVVTNDILSSFVWMTKTFIQKALHTITDELMMEIICLRSGGQ